MKSLEIMINDLGKFYSKRPLRFLNKGEDTHECVKDIIRYIHELTLDTKINSLLIKYGYKSNKEIQICRHTFGKDTKVSYLVQTSYGIIVCNPNLSPDYTPIGGIFNTTSSCPNGVFLTEEYKHVNSRQDVFIPSNLPLYMKLISEKDDHGRQRYNIYVFFKPTLPSSKYIREDIFDGLIPV